MKISVIIFIIVGIGILVYSNSLGNDFVWDDAGFVIQNDFIKDLGFIPHYFTSKSALAKGALAGENYRPFLTLSYAIDYYFWKLNPLGYHISNLVFHLASGLLVFYLALLLTKNRFIGFLSGLFFLTHPVQTEAVSWISGRADVLFLFFYLGALIAYIEYAKTREIRLYLASLLLFSCSLLSKEMAASLPLVIILYDFFYPRGARRPAEAVPASGGIRAGRKGQRIGRASRDFLRYSAYFLLLEAYLIVRLNILGRLAQCGYWTGNMYTTFLTMTKGIVYYIKLMVYPRPLCVDYLAFPVSSSIKEPEVIFSVAAIAAVTTGAILLAKKHKYISFSVLWFFITLGPAVNIIPIKILIADRFLYLPSIGYSIIVAAVLVSLYEKFKKKRLLGYFFMSLAVIIVTAYSYLTMERNTDWANDLTLWKKTVEQYPDNVRARHNLAVAYLEREEDMDKAYKEVMAALRIAPDYSIARVIVMAYHAQNNRFDQAVNEVRRILKDDPDFKEGYTYLGALYAMQNKYDLAYASYRKAIAKDPDFLEAKLAIASLHSIEGDIKLAIEKYMEILKNPPPHHYRPHYAVSYLALGGLYADLGDIENALKAWRRVHEDFGEQIWFNRISKFLTGETGLEELLAKQEIWQADFKVMCYYYIGVKKEMEGNRGASEEYYRKSIGVVTPALPQVKVLAAKRLEKLEER